MIVDKVAGLPALSNSHHLSQLSSCPLRRRHEAGIWDLSINWISEGTTKRGHIRDFDGKMINFWFGKLSLIVWTTCSEFLCLYCFHHTWVECPLLFGQKEVDISRCDMVSTAAAHSGVTRSFPFVRSCMLRWNPCRF